ncbi:MAG: DUF4442 domain-containing protein [Kangiellaceae bacterium]|nr:DUF4442 domain-containing protein [Kangiellaceae bacterium]
MYLSPKKLKFLLNFYPPYIGAGIKITNVSDDWKSLDVVMNLRWYNRNAVGSHFGGSLYSMVDPHLMLMLMQILGRDYYVWDKSASIEYIAPCRSQVRAHVRISEQQIQDIKSHTAQGEKYLPEFTLDVLDPDDQLVAKVIKQLYIRQKPKRRQD